MAKILGIDLGTTNSAVAVMEGGEGKILGEQRRGPHHSLDCRSQQIRRASDRSSG